MDKASPCQSNQRDMSMNSVSGTVSLNTTCLLTIFVSTHSYVDTLLAAEEKEGIPSDRVVVAGFSQGGAIALMMLRSEKKLAGVVGESTNLLVE